MFGGLSTEVAPSDLPEGASPLNWDCDFDIGAVHTRGGLTNAFSFADLTAGPNFSSASLSIPVNNNVWSSYQGQYIFTSWLSGQSSINWWNNFAFDVSPAGVTGIEAAISGHYGGSVSPECVLELTLSTDGRGVGIAKTFYFQNAESTVTVGGPSDTWSSPIAVAEINSPNFGVQFYGISPGQPCSLYVTAVTVKLYLARGLNNIDWIKTFIEDDQHTHTFVLDSAGVLWEEDMTDNPGVLTPQLETIYPNQFAYSHTNQNEEWIAFSDLRRGTNIPRHGTNFDRISQVGPGAPPSVSGQTTALNSWPIQSITQGPAQSDPASPGHFQAVNWSAGPTTLAPGNVLTIFYRSAAPGAPGPDATIGNAARTGGAVCLSGLTADFAGLNGVYVVTGQGFAHPPGSDPGPSGERWYFTVQTAATSPGNSFIGGPDQATGQYQVTLATMTLQKPANIQIGNQIDIVGASPAGWNNTWTITNVQNGGQYTINTTQLTAGLATYTYSIVNGIAPVVGQWVTVIGCVNGPFVNGSSIFNVTQQPVVTVTGSEFTIAIPGQPDVAAAAESGASAVSLGTIFQFDPGLNFIGDQTCANAVPGNDTGGTGTVSVVGQIGAGIRQAVTIFETRNGYLTAPSPPVTFGTTDADNAFNVTNVVIGPDNVIARIIAFTPANSGQFFYIPNDVTVTGLGQPQTYTATVIRDNINTQPLRPFNFTDAVLMAATAIDIQGNNLFNQIEVGASLAVVPYAGRNCYIGQNNKVQNFVNTTFDGGYLEQGQRKFPAGWTPDVSPNANGATVRKSPVFGLSYYIQSDGSNAPSNTYGAIHQSAFQDAYKVPILRPNTEYSVRIDARVPSGMNVSGQLFLDVVSYQNNLLIGSAGFPLSLMSPKFQTFVLPLVPKMSMPLDPPTDMILRLYAVNLPAGADVEIDRFEVFPTRQPDLLTDVYLSYIDNLEAVDGVSGDIGVSVQNNQPVLGAFTQYDLLYFLKTGSMFSTSDSAEEEPANWKVREVSNVVGTIGIHSYDASSATGGGEEWMITACRKGIYVFSGTEPVKISQEIQNVWEAINWEFGHTIIVRNDTAERRIMVQVPLATPNPWLPDAPLNANPTTPNVMLACSYKELQTASALAERGPVKLSFSGRLISWDMSRKWSIWQIPSPYSDFVRRPDGNDAYFIGNGRLNSKVYMLDDNALSDDGDAINGLYTTYGMPAPEQAQQFGQMVGMYRKLYKYSSYNISGAGLLKLRALINNLNPAYPYTVPGGIRLTCPVDHNREIPFNLEGQRLYLEFSTNGPGDNFGLSEVVLSIVKSAWSTVRGVN